MTSGQVTSESKPLLMLVSGWLVSASVWDALIPELGAEFEVVTYEIPGFGARRSEAPGWTFRGAVADLERAVSRLPRPAVLVGLSAGGSLALAVAAQRPANVAAVIGVGASPRWIQADDWTHGAPPEVASAMLEQGRARFLPFLQEVSPTIFFADDDRSAAEAAQNRVLEMAQAHASDQDAIDILERIYRDGDIRGDLARIEVPVLLVHGDRDGLTPPELGEAIRSMVPYAQVAPIAGAAHFPMLTAPTALAETIRVFVRGGRG